MFVVHLMSICFLFHCETAFHSIVVGILNQLLPNIAEEADTIFKSLFFANKYCKKKNIFSQKWVLLFGKAWLT